MLSKSADLGTRKNLIPKTDMALNIIKQKISEVATPKNAAAWDATTDKFLFAMRLLGIESCEPIWVDEAVAMLEDELEALLQK